MSSQIGPDRAIGIAGAGVAGLVLALRLKALGWTVTVFESRSETALRYEGAFLTLAPNGMNGLRVVGLKDDVAAAGMATTAIEISDETGHRLAVIDQTGFARDHGAASVTIARGTLLGLLLDAAGAAGVTLRLGAAVTRAETSGDAVRATYGNGGRELFPVLAACDGLGSAVRRAIFPEFPAPEPTGLIGTGGLLDVPDVPATGGTMRMTFGRDAFFGYQKEEGGPVFWYDSYPTDAVTERPRDAAAYAALLRRLHAPDPEINRRILAALEGIERDYPIRSMPPLPVWHRRRVVLVGDAAHAVGPHAGQGASMAIEDALVLADELARRPPEAAFAAYEARRRPRIEKVVAATERNASQKRASGWLARMLRRLLLPIFIPMGARAQETLAAYRVDHDLAAPEPAAEAA